MTTLFSHLKEFPTHSIHNKIVVWFESQLRSHQFHFCCYWSKQKQNDKTISFHSIGVLEICIFSVQKSNLGHLFNTVVKL